MGPWESLWEGQRLPVHCLPAPCPASLLYEHGPRSGGPAAHCCGLGGPLGPGPGTPALITSWSLESAGHKLGVGVGQPYPVALSFRGHSGVRVSWLLGSLVGSCCPRGVPCPGTFPSGAGPQPKFQGHLHPHSVWGAVVGPGHSAPGGPSAVLAPRLSGREARGGL